MLTLEDLLREGLSEVVSLVIKDSNHTKDSKVVIGGTTSMDK